MNITKHFQQVAKIGAIYEATKDNVAEQNANADFLQKAEVQFGEQAPVIGVAPENNFG